MKTRKVLDIDTMTTYHNVLLTLQLVLLEKLIMLETIPGFTSEVVVGFKPMLGLFNQFKYIH